MDSNTFSGGAWDIILGVSQTLKESFWIHVYPWQKMSLLHCYIDLSLSYNHGWKKLPVIQRTDAPWILDTRQAYTHRAVCLVYVPLTGKSSIVTKPGSTSSPSLLGRRVLLESRILSYAAKWIRPRHPSVLEQGPFADVSVHVVATRALKLFRCRKQRDTQEAWAANQSAAVLHSQGEGQAESLSSYRNISKKSYAFLHVTCDNRNSLETTTETVLKQQTKSQGRKQPG